jgi:hypothetical protein
MVHDTGRPEDVRTTPDDAVERGRRLHALTLPGRRPGAAYAGDTRLRSAEVTYASGSGAPGVPDRWSANASTIAATLDALRSTAPAGGEEEAASSPPSSQVRPPEAPAAQTRRLRREAEAGGRGRRGLFARILPVRAFRADDEHGPRGRHVAAVGERLRAAAANGVLTLPRRRAPGLRAVVDYVAVGPSGVFVLDARCGSNDLTSAAVAISRRAAAVREVLDEARLHDVAVTPVLCLVDGALPRGAAGLALGAVRVLSLNRLTALVSDTGSLDREHCATVRDFLAEQLPASA